MMTPKHQALRDAVAHIWADHQGWKPGYWPKDRRFDAIQIQQWTEREWPLPFWSEAIGMVPQGALFVFLTTPPKPGQVPRIEDWYIRWREKGWTQEKKRLATEFNSVGSILRRILETKGDPEHGRRPGLQRANPAQRPEDVAGLLPQGGADSHGQAQGPLHGDDL